MKKLLVAVAVSCAFGAFANEWYVDANNGNDLWDGTSSNHVGEAESTVGPRKTLKGAMEIPSLAENDTVWLLPGDYNEGEMSYLLKGMEYASTNRCYITKSGLRIRSTGGKAVTFVTGATDPVQSKFTEAYGGVRCFGIAADATNVVIEGVTMRTGRAPYKQKSPHYAGGGVMDQSMSAWVVDCLITDCRGARGGGVYGASLLRSELIETAAEGRGSGGESVPWMVNSVIWNTSGVSPLDTNPKKYPQVINCVIKGKSKNGLTQDANPRVYNSILVGSGYGDGAAKACVYTRCVVGNCTKDGGGSLAECVDCITNVTLAEVGYVNSNVNPFNWRIKCGSPARGFGDASHLANVPVPEGYSQYVDLYGNAIPTEGPIHAGVAQPLDWYVDGTNGDDANDGRSMATAFKTLRAATAVACCDTIHVAPGTYGEESEGTQVAPAGAKTLSRVVLQPGVTLESTEGAEKTVILGARCPADKEEPGGEGCGVGAVRCVYATDGAVIRGFTLSGGRTVSVSANKGVGADLNCAAIYAATGSRVRLEDSVVTNNVSYDYTLNAVDAVRCRIVDSATYDYGAAGYHCSWKNCFFDNLRGNRTLYNSYPPIENCTFGKNIYVNLERSNTGCIVGVNEIPLCPQVALNSVFAGRGSFWINSDIERADPDGRRPVETNCVFSTSMQNYDYGRSCNVLKLAADAIKIDADGRPLVGSPVIDACTNEVSVSADALEKDLDGAQRIQNGTVDMGAYEYDWRPAYAKTLGPKMSVTAAAPSVVKAGDTLSIASGAIEGTVGRTGPLVMDFAVTGTGSLKVYVNGELRGAYAAGDTSAACGDVNEGDSFRIVYEPGPDETGGATVVRCNVRLGLSLIVR